VAVAVFDISYTVHLKIFRQELLPILLTTNTTFSAALPLGLTIHVSWKNCFGIFHERVIFGKLE